MKEQELGGACGDLVLAVLLTYTGSCCWQNSSLAEGGLGGDCPWGLAELAKFLSLSAPRFPHEWGSPYLMAS